MANALDSDTKRAIYIMLLLTSVVAHFSCIILVSLFNAAIRSAARDADLWRLYVHNGETPSVVDTLFTIGNFAMAGVASFALLPVFGAGVSATFGSVVAVLCGVCMHILHKTRFLPFVHVVHGWKKHINDEYCTSIPLGNVRALANFDREMTLV